MEKNVISNKFDSVESFSRWLQVTPQTEEGRKRNLSKSICSYRTNFSGTESFEVADELMKFGDKENASKINASIRQLKAQGKGTETRNKLYNSPCGFLPIVPKVLAGEPQNMLAIKKQRYSSTKVLNVLYNITADFGIETGQMTETAAKVANVIASLEKNGYRVNLYAFFAAKSKLDKHSKASCLIKIKDSGKYLDTLRIAYPLINPSFLRRHLFAYLERLEEYKLYDGYGIPLKGEDAKKCVPLQNYCYLSYYLCEGKTEKEIAKMIENAK